MVPDRNDKSIVYFPFKLDNPVYKGITFITGMKITCDNPTCRCSDVYFSAKEADDNGEIIEPVKTHSFIIDIIKKKLKQDNYYNIPDWDVTFGRLFLSEMTDDIYRDLRRAFYTYKQDIAENANVNRCEFDFSQIESAVENEGYMVDYQELFPFCETFKVEYDNCLYFTADQYCLSSTCDCKHTGINIIEVAKDKKKDKGKPIATILYDYIKKKWELDNSFTQPEYSVNQILDRLNEENKDINNIFKNRHKRLRQIYSQYRSKNSIKKQVINPTRKTGRNEPCPCGSGKKYKKCCGK